MKKYIKIHKNSSLNINKQSRKMPVLSQLLLPTQWHDMIAKGNDDDFYDDDDIANFSKSEVFDIIEEAFDE